MRRVILTILATSLPAIAVACVATTHPAPLGDCDGPCYLIPPQDGSSTKDVAVGDTGVPDTGSPADSGVDATTDADASADASGDASSDADDGSADADDGALTD